MTLEESPIRITNQHTVNLRAHIRGIATATVHFDDDAVREYYDMEPDAPIPYDLVTAYATECEDLDPYWDMDDIDDFDRVDVESQTTKRVTIVPPSFVPLPGL
jgi:hypothetical protein